MLYQLHHQLPSPARETKGARGPLTRLLATKMPIAIQGGLVQSSVKGNLVDHHRYLQPSPSTITDCSAALAPFWISKSYLCHQHLQFLVLLPGLEGPKNMAVKMRKIYTLVPNITYVCITSIHIGSTVTLFRNKRFSLNAMFQQNASKLFQTRYFIPILYRLLNRCPERFGTYLLPQIAYYNIVICILWQGQETEDMNRLAICLSTYVFIPQLQM